MQPTLCSKCKKNVAVVFISRMNEKNEMVNEGFCLKCAAELGLPFSLLELKVYETKKKARYHQDVALTEEELAQPLEEHHYWLLEHGWEFAKPEEGSCGD